ncbi:MULTISPECIES: hypothetical protein [Helicobacter]|uniref:Periplasmic protein n=2 Tax=Helicobacter TaxID=209 RepID=T1DWJ5_9HELI|nr:MULTISPECIES: hypothetical protein [Helicobacter]EFR47653.1 hypothetical protein HCCG_02202 [Helicobacter cinaedi CCUG 18818 = ATCC BAA-847]QOQ91279.1 hypothetical protein HW260_02755 [Helicobacter cinaedi]STP14455.1 Uncharacterised protein [Helicobacter fennelliae]BAM32813.1 hypothetical protein HCBAA847_1583 [Helicobacter cinaedi CCUG 18818 = ATCC BAA-847]BBB20420.1 hypothetical protein HC081234_15970 [Helicobacter cinaedi]
MKRIFIFFILFSSLTFAQNPHKTRIYFSQNLTQPNPQCVEVFVKLVKAGNYEFESYRGDRDTQWVKEHISFEFDTWDNDKILVKLFFDWVDKNSREFQGTGTITWLEYDINTKTLKDNVQEKELIVDVNLANQFNDCLRYCNFSQTLALQSQFKDENILMQNEIIGTHAKERAYFYSAPHKNCKIDDLFLIPKDKLKLLQNKGEFSFVIYRRQNGEFIKLWIKSDKLR